MSHTRSQLECRVATTLIPMARAYRRHLDHALAGLSLSHSSGLAVMLLGRIKDGVRQGMLAEQLGVEGPTVVPLVDQIERAGLAERRSDATDKRAKTIHLTPAGRAVAAQAEVRSVEIRSVLFAGIPADDLAITLGVLEQLGRAIGAPETE